MATTEEDKLCNENKYLKDGNIEIEKITSVEFQHGVTDSKFIKPIRMNFRRRGCDLFWDMSLGQDSVVAIIYHTERKQLLFVKQFRPPVFVNFVLSLPENADKKDRLDEVRWEDYPIEEGCTLELCGGLVDEKGKTAAAHMEKEILEECGYRVNESDIRPISEYSVGISLSGDRQHLFYVELDESMREPTAGGGNAAEGEITQNVFMDVEKAKDLLKQKTMVSPPSLLFAVKWWIDEEYSKKCTI